MNVKWLVNIIITSILFLAVVPSTGHAQKMTKIKGVVIDANTKEPLPFVTIALVGKSIGTFTDYNGYFSIETLWASDSIIASFLGYSEVIKPVTIGGKTQVIDFELSSTSISLNEVTIVSTKKRYRNKNNLAVGLIKKVIENKNTNRKEGLSFYEYNKYEKVEFDLNNINDDFRKKKAFNQFQFIFDYVDTSEVNGKPYLPIFLKETLTKVYYKHSPRKQKEYISAIKTIGLPGFIDSDGINVMIDHMYQNIDIYENNIPLLTNQFVSPLSDIAPSIYKFHIMDTLTVNGLDCIQLSFQPRNKGDFAFKGNLYITNDDKYAVVKVDLKVMDGINLNFVTDLLIIQEFEHINNQSWALVRDELTVDFSLRKKGIGMYGKKTVYYDSYVFNEKRPDDIYSGAETTIKEDGYNQRGEAFWVQNRISTLTEREQGIYVMTNRVQNMPAFKRFSDILMLVAAGYWHAGNIDIGPVNTFYSFNDVEGLRLRIGGKTSTKFSERLRLDGYLMYGFKDKQFKYSGSAIWSLNNKSLLEIPKHTIKAMYQVETNFPGMDLQFINEDNFLLSFKRGVADKILYYKMYQLEHYRDLGNGLSTTLGFRRVKQEAGGSLIFEGEDYFLDGITSSEISARVRFAPNEKFYQGVDLKTPLATKYPIFQLTYIKGIKGLFNADHDYSKLTFNAYKRFHIAPIGFTKVEIEAGKVIGEGIPYPLLYVHRANQTYSYQLRSYNMMNFLEFVSDQYVSINAEHHFYGFFLNRIPLIKHLKLREIISFKALYGTISDQNNPNITSGLINFPKDESGNTSTFVLSDKPYIEVSAGIGNIFKFFRIDVIKRLTYLDNPTVSKLGIRGRFVLDF